MKKTRFCEGQIVAIFKDGGIGRRGGPDVQQARHQRADVLQVEALFSWHNGIATVAAT